MWVFCVLSHVLWNAGASSQWQHCGSGLLFRSKICIPVQSWFPSCRACHQLSYMSGIWEMEHHWGPAQMYPWVFFLFSCTHLSYPGSFYKRQETQTFPLICLSSDFFSGDLPWHWPLCCGTREMETDIWNPKPIWCYHDACMWPGILLQGAKDHSLPGQWNLELSRSQTSLWQYV